MRINNVAECYDAIALKAFEKLVRYGKRLDELRGSFADSELSREKRKALPSNDSSWKNIVAYISQQSDPFKILEGLVVAREHLLQKAHLTFNQLNAFGNAAYRRYALSTFFGGGAGAFFLSQAESLRNAAIFKMEARLNRFEELLVELEQRASFPQACAA